MRNEDAIVGYELSPQQRRIFQLLDGAHEGRYVSQCAITLEGQVNRIALRTALESVVARHPILGMTLQRLVGMTFPLQVDENKGVKWYDEPDITSNEKPIVQLLQEIAPDGIDLTRGPMVHARILPLPVGSCVLLVKMPALCADYRSLKALVEEISKAYLRTAETARQLDYFAVSEWLNEILQLPESEPGKAFWRTQWNPELLAVTLPYELRHKDLDDLGVSQHRAVVDQESGRLLNNFVHQGDASVAALFLNCWHVLSWYLTDHRQFIVGFGCGGRTDPELAGIIGPLSRSVPLTFALDVNSSFENSLRAVAVRISEAEDWQESFTWTDLDGSALSETQFIPVQFEYVTVQPRLEGDGGVHFRISDQYICADRFNLRLICSRVGEDFVVEFHYDRRYFQSQDIECLSAQYRALLRNVLFNPARNISQLDIVDGQDRLEMLSRGDDNREDCQIKTCIHELIEDQGERTPHRIAIVLDDIQLTYKELNCRAERVAHRLQALGVGPDVVVGVCLERSLEMVIGLLATLKAGGAFLPLDPSFPEDRLAFMTRDSSVSVLLTQEKLRAMFSGTQAEVVCMDALWSSKSLASRRSVKRLSPANIAYIIYTSGSSGQPKAVMVTHLGLCNHMLWMGSAFPLNEADAVLQRTSLSFDASVWEVFASLIAGARLVLAKPDCGQDPASLITTIATENVTVVQFVPTLLQLLLEQPDLGECQCVKRFFCGGEVLPPELGERLLARLDVTLHNLYGPTEATIDATAWTWGSSEIRRSTPIGRPIANTQAYLLDTKMTPVPVGRPGRLYIGGVGLARGYLGRADMTAERFLPNPLALRSGERFYDTGDMARYLPDGNIEFLGRTDDQIKIHGLRIELGEVESCLTQHPMISACVVLPQENDDHSTPNALVAYAIPRPLHKLPNGIEIDHMNRGETDFLYNEIFEQEVYLRNGITVQDGDCIFDVGANIGLFTLFLHHTHKNVRVYAFEPSPPVFEILRRNVALYSLDVKTFPLGLSSEQKTGKFTFYPKMSGSSGVYADAARDLLTSRAYLLNRDPSIAENADGLLAGRFETREFTCQFKTLSDIIREEDIERIDLLKIDVEKSEIDVIAGTEARDWAKIKQIVLEVHDLDGRLTKVVEVLKTNGYRVYVEQEGLLAHTELYNVYASRGRDYTSEESGWSKESTLLSRKVTLTTKGCRQFLGRKLPDYMIPQSVVVVQSFPRLPNGKIDRIALLQSVEARSLQEQPYVAPRNLIEKNLADIWAEILNLEKIGIHDDFFALGGDSIRSIQIIARAKGVGIHLTTKQIFTHPTLAELAAVAEEVKGPTAADGGVTWPLPLTPIQQWFLQQTQPNHHHWNHSVLLDLRTAVNPLLVRRTFDLLVRRHDALRIRLMQVDSEWRQSFSSAEDSTVPFVKIDLTGVSESDQEEAIRAVAGDLQSGLNLYDGPLLQVALFDLGQSHSGRLLVIIHHLAIDAISWRILCEDFEAVYDQLERNATIELPPEATTFETWTQRLSEYALSADIRQAVNYWSSDSFVRASSLPICRGGVNNEASARTVWITLSTEASLTLHTESRKPRGVRMNEIVLAALARACQCSLGMPSSLLIDIEKHGREEVLDDVDITRTVGWFTVVYPVLIDARRDATEILRMTTRQLRAAPIGGLSYGLLRYIEANKEVAAKLRKLPAAEVSFNYLGQLDREFPEDSLFLRFEEFSHLARDPDGIRPYLLEFTASTVNGLLRIGCTYSANVHSQSTIEKLTKHCLKELESLAVDLPTWDEGLYAPQDWSELDRRK